MKQTSGKKIKLEYDDASVRMFMIASIFWGAVGMLAGVLVASQLNYWKMNFDLEWLSFGRLRPLHTNAAIFAFVGNMMFAGVYYSTQRLVKARLASDILTKIHFWGWQLIIVAAAITLPLGYSRGKEYAELIWPINIAVAVIWLVFALNFFWTLAKRNERCLYVAVWFYIATIITITMLYVVNHLSIPTSLLHSYPVFGGVQDALVQWWYGHNAVAFFLTTPILGIMYYFIPKAAGRPVYSYRLSVIHFWSLVFIYIWAGPHHLLNTSLPHWLQILGMLFSVMLWAPSWGGMLNGLLTIRGSWDKLRTDPVLKFFAAAVTFYGMATFEGPLLSIRAVNALGHYTDWIIGHVHGGTLGWNGFMAAGMFYWLAPRLWNTKLHSIALANMHFWIGLFGILLYVASMWVSGIMQGLMLNGVTEDGLLMNPDFVATLEAIKPMMLTRMLGGALYLVGFLLMCYNIYMTVKSGKAVNGVAEVDELVVNDSKVESMMKAILSSPFILSACAIFFLCVWVMGNDLLQIVGIFGTFAFVFLMMADFKSRKEAWVRWHDRLLDNAIPLTVLTLLSVGIGGLVQILPTVVIHKAASVEDRVQELYTPLELEGRDIYIREGCYNCHSQMIRTLVPDVMRYGEYSRLGESIYDHPYQWGSRRIGPDLARIGGKYPDIWHFRHMRNPREINEKSNMPNYGFMMEKNADWASLPTKIKVQRMVGVPYPKEWTPAQIKQMTKDQAKEIAKRIRDSGEFVAPEKEIVAMIAYLQAIGKSKPVNKQDEEVIESVNWEEEK